MSLCEKKVSERKKKVRTKGRREGRKNKKKHQIRFFFVFLFFHDSLFFSDHEHLEYKYK